MEKMEKVKFKLSNVEDNNSIESLEGLSFEKRFLGFNVSIYQDNNAEELELCKYTTFGYFVNSYILKSYTKRVMNSILNGYLELCTSSGARRSGCAGPHWFTGEGEEGKWKELVSGLETKILAITNFLSSKDGEFFLNDLIYTNTQGKDEFELLGFQYFIKITPKYAPTRIGVNFIPTSCG